MIKQENPNFLASVYAPNPMEVTYWIDLYEDAKDPNVIDEIPIAKSFLFHLPLQQWQRSLFSLMKSISSAVLLPNTMAVDRYTTAPKILFIIP